MTNLKNGTVVAVAGITSGGTTGKKTSSTPSTSPNEICPTSFHLATRPRDFPCTILR